MAGDMARCSKEDGADRQGKQRSVTRAVVFCLFFTFLCVQHICTGTGNKQPLFFIRAVTAEKDCAVPQPDITFRPRFVIMFFFCCVSRGMFFCSLKIQRVIPVLSLT